MFPRLVLFDIDLTLIRSTLPKGPGMAALGGIVQELTGFEGDLRIPVPDGQTDPDIVQQLFEMNGLVYEEALYEKVMSRYFPKLKEIFSTEGLIRLLPGVRELLEELHRRPDFYTAVVTGNDERGADIKLTPFELRAFLPIGAYGSDSTDRGELIRIATKRARLHYNTDFIQEFTFMIGDSPNDIRAANQAGVRAVGVLTGNAGEDDLKQIGPCRVVADLSNTEEMVAMLSDR